MPLNLPFVSRADYDDACVSIRQLEENVREARSRATASETALRDMTVACQSAMDQAAATESALGKMITRAESMLEQASVRYDALLAKYEGAVAQHHELAMHPPTGILTGPAALSPISTLGPKTQEAIKAMSAGLSHANRDAMIAKAFQQKAAKVDDDQIAEAIMRGESVKPPTHLRS